MGQRSTTDFIPVYPSTVHAGIPQSIISTDLAGISLPNPVMLAAGTCGTLHEFADVLDLSRIGGLVSKSVTRLPREGNPTHRILDAGPRVSGMINAIGLANPGVDAFIRDYLPRAANLRTNVTLSVAGFSIDDYLETTAKLDSAVSSLNLPNVRAIELNVSCPNVHTGTEFGNAPDTLRDLLKAVRPTVKNLRLFVKLSPLAPDILGIARAAAECGVDALTVANTVPAMSIDVHTRRPRLANVTGGLSGPAVHPLAVRLVHLLHSKLCRNFLGEEKHLPIIGVGGVSTWEDAAEFILAGASAVQMGTALYADPRSPLRVVRGLEKWVKQQRVSHIRELVGAVALAT